MAEVFIALGSNLGDRAEHLRRAVLALRGVIRIEKISSLWDTEPVGLKDQPDFLNAALGGTTDLAPRPLLAALAEVEDRWGRVREIPNGPRTLDLDLLTYDGLRVNEVGLTIPHPRMKERRFVLAPLAEIAPALQPVRGGSSVADLLAVAEGHEAVRVRTDGGWPPPID